MNTFFQTLDSNDLYVITVVGSALLLIFLGLSGLRKAEHKRLRRTGKMEFSDAIESDLYDSDEESITRNRAVSSIESHFSFLRKVYVPFIILLSIGFITVPLLPTFSATYVSLFAGVLAVLAGLAARPVVENVISGIVIMASQPIRINDTVIIDEKYGTVEKIALLYTVIKVWNWRRYIIPNHKLLQKEFENLTQSDEQEWAHVEFHVAPGSDIELVKKIAKESMQSKYLNPQERPSFWVVDLGKDSVKCWIAGWARNASEAWALRSHTRKMLALNLHKANINTQLINSTVKLEKQSPQEPNSSLPI